MKILITGGGGFLGHRLAEMLLQKGSLCGSAISHVVLFDAHFHRKLDDPRVQQVAGSVADSDSVKRAFSTDVEVVFHLASMVSGECEEHFEKALHVNLDGCRHLLECARNGGKRPRFLFASSVACYGGLDMSQSMGDCTKHLPQTTYGMTKAICEMLVNDYTRKGYLDGRSLRLPTVIVRPGRPNAAASSWASGMFREPLQGEACHLPIRLDQPHPMTGYRTVVESFIRMAEVPETELKKDRAYVLPAHRVTPELARNVIEKVAPLYGISLGETLLVPDARIQGIVDNWPQQVDGSRAEEIGLPSPPALEEIVAQYIEDYLQIPRTA